jgi:DNA-binding protein HU-beta
MNQTELIAAVAERTGLTKADAGKAVEALVGTITDTLKQGDEIRIAGFGTFGISERGERQGRNPQTGAQITISRRRRPPNSPPARPSRTRSTAAEPMGLRLWYSQRPGCGTVDPSECRRWRHSPAGRSPALVSLVRCGVSGG